MVIISQDVLSASSCDAVAATLMAVFRGERMIAAVFQSGHVVFFIYHTHLHGFFQQIQQATRSTTRLLDGPLADLPRRPGGVAVDFPEFLILMPPNPGDLKLSSLEVSSSSWGVPSRVLLDALDFHGKIP